MACLFAGSPTLRSPFFKKATTEGVVRRPSSFAITTGSFPSITETQLLVVPKSIPMIFAMCKYLFINRLWVTIVNLYAKGKSVQKWQSVVQLAPK